MIVGSAEGPLSFRQDDNVLPVVMGHQRLNEGMLRLTEACRTVNHHGSGDLTLFPLAPVLSATFIRARTRAMFFTGSRDCSAFAVRQTEANDDRDNDLDRG